MLLLLSMAFSAVTILPEAASATTLYVGGAGPGNYTMIQDAIDDANPGDTVYVFTGTYDEGVEINEKLSLVGEDRNSTIIQDDWNFSTVSIRSPWVNISGFTVVGGSGGMGFMNVIYISSVHNCTVSGNIVLNGSNGIRLNRANDTRVIDNVIAGGWTGIAIGSSSRVILQGNSISISQITWSAIAFSSSSYITATNNVMSDGGIDMGEYALTYWDTHHIDTSNTVNGGPVYYWKGISGGTVPVDAGQVILANCTGVSVENITFQNVSRGIQLGFSSHNRIAGIGGSNGGGLYLYASDENEIVNSTLLSDASISLAYSDNNTVTGNRVVESYTAITLRYSDNNTIEDNDLSNNTGEGLYTYLSLNNTIAGNRATNNRDGIFIQTYSDWNTIVGNVASDNEHRGIYQFASRNNTVTSNTVANNGHTGIMLTRSNHTLVYHNNLLNNTAQAEDGYFTNQWDDGYPSGGNYWSDYSGIDNCSGPNQDICPDPDGIGDTPYIIDTDSQDNYPLMGPYELPATPPEITATYPFDFQIDVLPEQPINVTFSKQMNITSINWTIVPNTDLTPSWSLNDRLLTLSHSEYFVTMTIYTVTISEGEDVDGNQLVPGLVPNPWSFSIMGCSPSIESTDPFDGEVNVSLNRSILVEFSHIMDPSSLTWVIDPYVQLTANWTNENRVLELNHSDQFDGDTEYSVLIDAENKYGNPITPGPVPNPWNFTTCCNPPEIINTDPFDGQTQVPPDHPINVTFSEPMDTTSVNWTIEPYIDLTPSWSQNDELLTLSHAEHFVMMTIHTMTITDAKDVEGYGLIPGQDPYAWSFSTSCSGTWMISTNPNDQETNVPINRTITVNFDSCAEPSSLEWNINPYVELQPLWSVGNTRLNLTHVEDFESGTEYTMSLYVEDEYGGPLLPGPVPNPWTWTTEDLPEPFPPSEPPNLQAVAGYQRVALTWDPPLDDGDLPVDNYVIYRGIASGSLALLAEISNETTYEDTGLTNGQIYFYRVSAKNAAGEGPYSNEVNATPFNSPPACSISSPAAGLTISGTFLV
ncbi:MAG: Ig-like domain-containing protein, partial [Thermoplasmata archaeon]